MTDDYVPYRPMMAHQAEFFERFGQSRVAALWWEPRCRKTKPVVDTWRWAVQRGSCDAMLVFAYPAGVHLQWLDEIPLDVPPESWGRVKAVAWRTGIADTASGRADLDDLLKAKYAVLVCNCHALLSETCWSFLRKFVKAHRVLCVADEASFACRWSRRTKRLITLGRWPGVVARRTLDGTPADEGVDDLYFPCDFLENGLLGFDSPTAYRNYYMDREERTNHNTMTTYMAVNGYRHLDELRGRMWCFGTRVRRREVSNAPEPVRQVRRFELTSRQREVYVEVEATYMAELEGRTVTATNVLKRMIRLSMVARNYWPPERHGVRCPRCGGGGFAATMEECETCEGTGIAVEVSAIHRIDRVNPAQEALEFELAGTRGPAVVWARFQQDAEDAAEVARRVRGRGAVGMYYGRQTQSKNEAAYRAFRAGEIDALVATVQSGVTRGHDLSRAEAAVYYSSAYSQRDRGQSEDRTENLDRETPTDIVDLIAADTKDEEVYRALRDKKSIAGTIMGDPQMEDTI